MLYVIFDDMSQCTPAQVECLLPLVSQQRREQALRYTHTFGQYTCLKSYCMLQELLQQWGKQRGREVPLCPKFNYNEYGAPSIDGGPFFSISHCKQAIAVVVSDAPVGIDIESIRPMNEGLVARTMDAIEQDAIFSSSNPELSFARLWTRKEAYLKLKGTGIINDLRGVLTNTEHLSWHEINAASSMYVCTIVSE